MSKHHKNTSLSILYVFVVTIFGIQNSNSVSAYKIIDNDLGFGIRKEKEEIDNSNPNVFKINYSSPKIIKNAVVGVDQKFLENKNKTKSDYHKMQALLSLEVEDFAATEKLIANVSLENFAGKNPEDSEIKTEPNIALDLIRKVSLFFFLLFFVPLGIFYPLFLLYKKLLDTDEDSNPLEEEVFENSLPISLSSEDVELDLYPDQATISKLQVAFLPKVINLKHQLEQARLNIDKQGESEAIDLMRSAISIFITQQHWTHANCESISYPSVEAQKQFDTVLSIEQDKYINKNLSVVNTSQQKHPDKYITQDDFNYTVVTMFFFTIGSEILFNQIDTKESLAKLLIDLSQMNKNNLLKFELVWNPLKEDEFITNEELLIQYEDMMRLF